MSDSSPLQGKYYVSTTPRAQKLLSQRDRPERRSGWITLVGLGGLAMAGVTIMGIVLMIYLDDTPIDYRSPRPGMSMSQLEFLAGLAELGFIFALGAALLELILMVYGIVRACLLERTFNKMIDKGEIMARYRDPLIKKCWKQVTKPLKSQMKAAGGYFPGWKDLVECHWSVVQEIVPTLKDLRNESCNAAQEVYGETAVAHLRRFAQGLLDAQLASNQAAIERAQAEYASLGLD